MHTELVAPQIAALGAVVFGLSYWGVAGLRRWAEQRRILDLPNDRSSHTRPTPRGGGLAIVVLSLTGWGLYVWLHPQPVWQPWTAYALGAVLIAAIGGWDDLYSLPNRVRFAAHLLAAVIAVWGCGSWSHVVLPGVGDVPLGLVGAPVTVLWIVWLTNAYNFMDGIDGIAGGQAVVAGFGWAALGWLSGQPMCGILGLLLAASSLGFLGHNWAPARIFMGDVGSTFLGYSFAVLPVIAARDDPRLALAGILFVWPFIFDTTFTLLRRARRHENIFAAHRSHLYQRLIITGHSHRGVSLLYIVGGVLGVLLALAWSQRIAGSAAVLLFAIPLLCSGLWGYVIYCERRRLPDIHDR